MRSPSSTGLVLWRVQCEIGASDPFVPFVSIARPERSHNRSEGQPGSVPDYHPTPRNGRNHEGSKQCGGDRTRCRTCDVQIVLDLGQMQPETHSCWPVEDRRRDEPGRRDLGGGGRGVRHRGRHRLVRYAAILLIRRDPPNIIQPGVAARGGACRAPTHGPGVPRGHHHLGVGTASLPTVGRRRGSLHL